jgi:uncharacterized protein (TIGR02117 family)
VIGAYWGPPTAQPSPGLKQFRIAVFWSPIHTDIILPVEGVSVDWRTVLSGGDPSGTASNAGYLAFGWGSESFYRNVPTMADITPGILLRALFFDRTVMHVTPIGDPESIPAEHRTILSIPKDRLKALEQFVLASFARDGTGPVSLIAGESYGYGDTFYLAEGRYWPIRTCNQWTGEGLRLAGIPVGYWTPFSQSISWILGEAPPSVPIQHGGEHREPIRSFPPAQWRSAGRRGHPIRSMNRHKAQTSRRACREQATMWRR